MLLGFISRLLKKILSISLVDFLVKFGINADICMFDHFASQILFLKYLNLKCFFFSSKFLITRDVTVLRICVLSNVKKDL